MSAAETDGRIDDGELVYQVNLDHKSLVQNMYRSDRVEGELYYDLFRGTEGVNNDKY